MGKTLNYPFDEIKHGHLAVCLNLTPRPQLLQTARFGTFPHFLIEPQDVEISVPTSDLEVVIVTAGPLIEVVAHFDLASIQAELPQQLHSAVAGIGFYSNLHGALAFSGGTMHEIMLSAMRALILIKVRYGCCPRRPRSVAAVSILSLACALQVFFRLSHRRSSRPQAGLATMWQSRME